MGVLPLVNSKTNISDQRVDLVLLFVGVTTFEIIEDIEVLARGQKVKQNVMLRTNSHEFTDLVHFLEDVDVIAKGAALGLLDKASEH